MVYCKGVLVLLAHLAAIMWTFAAPTIQNNSLNNKGKVYYRQPSGKMNLAEAQQACQNDGAQIAEAEQVYHACKFAGLDLSNAGWLADGSVTRRLRSCGSSELAVRSFHFQPPKTKNKFGVYCYKLDD